MAPAESSVQMPQTRVFLYLIPKQHSTGKPLRMEMGYGILVDNFLGIKYGTFEERFAPSQPLVLSASDGPLIVNATECGQECPNPSAAAYDEDCLYLNIYRPSGQKDGLLRILDGRCWKSV